MKTKDASALAKLLQDDDLATLQLIRKQISENSDSWTQPLSELAASPLTPSASIAKKLLSEIQRKNAHEDFLLSCFFLQDHSCLESAYWALSAAISPETDLSPFKNTLDSWGRSLLLKASTASTPLERTEILLSFLTSTLGFRFFIENPDSPLPLPSLHQDFIHLPSVISSRFGWGFSIVCLTFFLAQRAGINLAITPLAGVLRIEHCFFGLTNNGFQILPESAYLHILQDLPSDTLAHSSPYAKISSRLMIRILLEFLLLCPHPSPSLSQITAWLDAIKSDS